MPTIVYEKPNFVRQWRTNTCWYACLRMLKGFHTGNTNIGESPKIQDLKSWVTGRSYKDIDPAELDVLVPGAKAKAMKMNFFSFYQFLKDNGPFMGGGAIGIFGIGHAIFIYGIKDDKLMYHDPFSGECKTMDLSEYRDKADGEYLYKQGGGDPTRIVEDVA